MCKETTIHLRVDTATSKGNQDNVWQKDGKSNGQRSHVGRSLGERLLVDGCHEDCHAKDHGAHEFQNESIALYKSRIQAIGTQSKGRISNNSFDGFIISIFIHFRHGCPQEEGSQRGTGKLGAKVRDELDQFTFTNHVETIRHGGVEVTSRNVSETVGLDQNSYPKGKGNRQDAGDRSRRRSGTWRKLLSCKKRTYKQSSKRYNQWKKKSERVATRRWYGKKDCHSSWIRWLKLSKILVPSNLPVDTAAPVPIYTKSVIPTNSARAQRINFLVSIVSTCRCQKRVAFGLWRKVRGGWLGRTRKRKPVEWSHEWRQGSSLLGVVPSWSFLCEKHALLYNVE